MSLVGAHPVDEGIARAVATIVSDLCLVRLECLSAVINHLMLLLRTTCRTVSCTMHIEPHTCVFTSHTDVQGRGWKRFPIAALVSSCARLCHRSAASNVLPTVCGWKANNCHAAGQHHIQSCCTLRTNATCPVIPRAEGLSGNQSEVPNQDILSYTEEEATRSPRDLVHQIQSRFCRICVGAVGIVAKSKEA